MAAELTIEKVIEHHLTGNMGQKLTPQLVTGLVIHISQNIRTSGAILSTMGMKPVAEQVIDNG